MLKLLKYFSILSFTAIIILVAATGYALIEKNPIVYYRTSLSDSDLARAKQLLKDHDPRNASTGDQKNLVLKESDANLLVNSALKKTALNMQSKLKFYTDSSYIAISLKLPEPLGTYYINGSASLVQTGPVVFRVDRIRIGAIELNASMSRQVAKLIYNKVISQYPETKLAVDSLQSVKLLQHQMQVVYMVNHDSLALLKKRGSEYLIPKSMKIRLTVYQNALADLTNNLTISNPSLTYLLQPLFVLAEERSLANQAPVEENRALLMTLGAYIVGRNFNKYIDNDSGKKVKYLTFMLNKREDLPKHFLVSAALVAVADNTLANLIGLQKEVLDSQGGSGFSFADLAADRAGVKLANKLLASSMSSGMQSRMSKIQRESDFMPVTSILPEGLQDIDFKLIYKHTESVEYKRVVNQIDQMIQRRPVFQGI